MNESIDAYLRTILQERDWSWTIAAIVFICFGFMVRTLVLRPLVRKAKEVNRKDYGEIKKQYLKRSLWGWIFFILSMIFAVGMWKNPVAFPLNIHETLALLGAVGSFLLSLIFHLMALGAASLVVLAAHKENL